MKLMQQFKKGSTPLLILSVLEEESMYGYQIMRELETRSQGYFSLTAASLYPTLHKLEAKGLLSVEIKTVNNRPRKYYFLTENGKKETVNLLNEMKTFIQHMDVLLNPKLA